MEDTGIDGMIILKWIFKTWDGGMSYAGLAQDRDRWRAFFQCCDEHSGSINGRNFLSSCGPVSFSGRTLLHGVSCSWLVGWLLA